MSYKLRPYQAECVERVEDSFKADLVKSALVVLPTGTGKTVCFTEMAKREEGRTLIVCPMRELIHQAADKIKEVTGEVAASAEEFADSPRTDATGPIHAAVRVGQQVDGVERVGADCTVRSARIASSASARVTKPSSNMSRRMALRRRMAASLCRTGW